MGSEPPEAGDRRPEAPRDLSAPATRAILMRWAHEGKWAEISLSGASMMPLIPDGSRLTVRFGRQGLAAGDVVLYATDTRLIAHRVLRLGRRGRHWGFLKVKGDPVRSGEATWIPVEEILGRVVALRTPGGAVHLLNTSAARIANRAAAAISGSAGWLETRVRGVLGAGRTLTLTPAVLSLLGPLYSLSGRGREREAGLFLRMEERFLLAACRVRFTSDDERRVRGLLRKEILWGRLPASATALGLAPLLYRNLSRPAFRDQIPAEVLAALARNARATAIQMSLQLESLDEAVDAMRARGLEPILLKGAALALTLYERPWLRPMQDIDLLVEPHQVSEAVACLESLRYRALVSGRTPAFYAGHHHAAPMIGKGGRIIVEVHRGLVPPEDGLHVEPAPFVARSLRITTRGRSYRILAREDQIVHACLHLSYCDRFVGRLRDIIDVHALVQGAGAPDWGQILESAHRWEIHRSLYSSLDLARRLLGAQVPREVLAELSRGSRWDPVAERLLRLFARASLFMGGGSDGLLPDPSARWACGTLIKRARWGGRLRDLAALLGEA